MVLVNVKPLGFAYGEILTSVQMNSVTSQLPNAVDGIGGGAYVLANPLSITGDVVTFDTITVPSVVGNTTFSADVTVNDDIFVLDSVFVTGSVEVGASLQVAGTAYLNSNLSVAGALITPMTTSGTGRITKRLLVPGPNLDASLGPKDYDIVMAVTVSATRAYTIDDTGAVNGDTMLFRNQSGSNYIDIKDPGGATMISIGGGLGQQWALVARVAGSWVTINFG
jgi:hypothetical protein